jgi:hypothetical protein
VEWVWVREVEVEAKDKVGILFMEVLIKEWDQVWALVWTLSLEVPWCHLPTLLVVRLVWQGLVLKVCHVWFPMEVLPALDFLLEIIPVEILAFLVSLNLVWEWVASQEEAAILVEDMYPRWVEVEVLADTSSSLKYNVYGQEKWFDFIPFREVLVIVTWVLVGLSITVVIG